MKPAALKILALACLALIWLATAAPLQAAPTGPQIRVTGESQHTVAPDHAVMEIRMENKAASSRVAEEFHKKILDMAQKTLNNQKVDPADVHTSGPWMGTGNTMTTTLAVTIRDLDRLSALAQALSAKPNTTVAAITYHHTRMAELVEKTRTHALLDARDKAQSMTRVLDVALGKAVYIRELDAAVSTTPADPGTPDIRIRNKIEVIFGLGSEKE